MESNNFVQTDWSTSDTVCAPTVTTTTGWTYEPEESPYKKLVGKSVLIHLYPAGESDTGPNVAGTVEDIISNCILLDIALVDISYIWFIEIIK